MPKRYKGKSKTKKREKWVKEHSGYTRKSWAKEKRKKRLEKT